MKLQKVKDTKTLMNISEAIDTISDETEEEIDAVTEPGEETTPAETKAPEVSAEEATKTEEVHASFSFAEAVNSLTQNYWNDLSFIKSIIATLEGQEKVDFSKEDILTLLNTMAEDVTIGIGMLAKVSEMIDGSTKALMDVGAEKAEEILQSDQSAEEKTEHPLDESKSEEGQKDLAKWIDDWKEKNPQKPGELPRQWEVRCYNDYCKAFPQGSIVDLKRQALDDYFKTLDEAATKRGVCVICGKELKGYGNNAEPVKVGLCCDRCYTEQVIPARLQEFSKLKGE